MCGNPGLPHTSGLMIKAHELEPVALDFFDTAPLRVQSTMVAKCTPEELFFHWEENERLGPWSRSPLRKAAGRLEVAMAPLARRSALEHSLEDLLAKGVREGAFHHREQPDARANDVVDLELLGVDHLAVEAVGELLCCP